MAGQLGFRSNAMNNALSYGNENYVNRGGRGSSHLTRGLGYEDDSRRGYYVPDDTRSKYQQVPYNRNAQGRDIAPALPDRSGH